LRVLTSLYIVGRGGSGPPSCRPKNRVVPVPALRDGNKAQARHYLRAVPGTSMMGSCSGRARTVLFSASPAGLVHLANYVCISPK
jgi:hypothetical protein